MSDPGWIQFAPPCETGEATTKRTTRFRGSFLRVDFLEADVERTLTTTAQLTFEGGTLVFSLNGTFLYREDRATDWRLAAPRSATVVIGSEPLSVRIARGHHEALAIYWPRGSMPILEQWLRVREAEGQPRPLGTHPIHPRFSATFARLEEALAAAEPTLEHVLAGIVMEMASSLILAANSHSLAAVPGDLPPTISRLIEAVRANPARPWPLKEAADFVGYSPFHFSRIYKQLVGIGFHEFVDRTRTEMAVQLLTTTDQPIDLVASETGFGTSQGLRESVKEYLGLVPSELRSNNDEG